MKKKVKKDASAHIRLNPEHRDILEREAHQMGYTKVSPYIRHLIFTNPKTSLSKK